MQLTEFPKADHALTDSEILSLYGDVLREGISAFRTDPTYVVDIAEAAARYKKSHESRSNAAKRRNAVTSPKASRPPSQIRVRILELHSAGFNQREIGEQVGRTQGTVAWYLRSSLKNSA